ncbi:hypothetical protein [Catalinimonas alkaloidigena]|uniref:hypothetical protein n=1 Tax=Catalinimonas alkaloidigena TaxID=1075417 RepID=UPI00115FAA6F|nr:hypothetical protein [Catalinimonas alkaloidigena]
MKRVILYIFLFQLVGIPIGIGQNLQPFYEQIAFGYYRNEILAKKPVNKKIRIYTQLETERGNPFGYPDPECIEKFGLTLNDSLLHYPSLHTQLALTDLNDQRFKIRKRPDGKYPAVFVGRAYTTDDRSVIVTISQIHRSYGDIYYIILDPQGNIIGWCETGYVV